jgi:hypothetical protein
MKAGTFLEEGGSVGELVLTYLDFPSSFLLPHMITSDFSPGNMVFKNTFLLPY